MYSVGTRGDYNTGDIEIFASGEKRPNQKMNFKVFRVSNKFK